MLAFAPFVSSPTQRDVFTDGEVEPASLSFRERFTYATNLCPLADVADQFWRLPVIVIGGGQRATKWIDDRGTEEGEPYRIGFLGSS